MNSLHGHFYVVPTPSARLDARKLFPRDRDYYELRYHALKLRWWPQASDASEGELVEDLNWEWVKGVDQRFKNKIGELRIDDVINGNDNLRIFFLVCRKTLAGDPLPRIWLLRTMQKKSQKLTSNDLKTLQARATIVLSRYYP